jgi:tetratricopeptide (TPR) repeat protein
MLRMENPLGNLALELKNKGNYFFKSDRYEEAKICYSEAIEVQLKSSDSLDLNGVNILFNNRAACYLKLGQYDKAIKDCSEVLKHSATDAKALYRRAQAQELNFRYAEAFRDLKRLLQIDSKNKAALEAAARVSSKLQKISSEGSVSDFLLILQGKVPDYAIGASVTPEIKNQAIGNLLVLLRSNKEIDSLLEQNTVSVFLSVIENHVTESRKGRYKFLDSDKELLQRALEGLSLLVSFGSYKNVYFQVKEFLFDWLSSEMPIIRKGASALFIKFASRCEDFEFLVELYSAGVDSLARAFESKEKEVLSGLCNTIACSLNEENVYIFIKEGPLDSLLDNILHFGLERGDFEFNSIKIAAIFSQIIEVIFKDETIVESNDDVTNQFKERMKTAIVNAMHSSTESKKLCGFQLLLLAFFLFSFIGRLYYSTEFSYQYDSKKSSK